MPATESCLAVRRQRDDRLKLGMVAQLSADEAVLSIPDAVQQRPGLRLARVHTTCAVLERRVVGEQIDDVVPHRAVDVVTVDCLQPLDLGDVGEPHRALRERNVGLGCMCRRDDHDPQREQRAAHAYAETVFHACLAHLSNVLKFGGLPCISRPTR